MRLLGLIITAAICNGVPSQLVLDVPIQSSCHRVISITDSAGSIKSHEGYPDKEYEVGHQCRIILNFPPGTQNEVSVRPSAKTALRPWDFATIVDGSVLQKLEFICNVERYKLLGQSGQQYIAVVQKYLSAGLTRFIKTNSSTVVVDFCVHTFTKDLANRRGFLIEYTSTNIQPPTTTTTTEEPTTEPDTEIQIPQAANQTKFFNRRFCGRPQNPPSNNPNNRIVHGVYARENSHPWICALVQKPTLHFCGCTLIKEQWVVTAGHCVDNTDDTSIKQTVEVYMGVEDLRRAGADKKYRITRIIRHPDYNIPPGSTANDIALMKLDRPVTFSNDVMPACLPDRSVHERVPAAQYALNGRRICWVAGWGRLYDGQSPGAGGKIGAGTDHLQQVAIEVMSMGDCRNFLSSYVITDKMFCGGYDRGYFDSCQGDSGGPMVCDDGNGVWNLYGVVSWGIGCAQERAPGIYTNIALMRPWIESHIGRL